MSNPASCPASAEHTRAEQLLLIALAHRTLVRTCTRAHPSATIDA